MKKAIRIIDLLNMISKGEEAPKKIRYFGEEFKLAKGNEYYSVYSSKPLISYFGEDYLRAELNDEVEILDEEEFEDINDEFESGDTAQVVMQLLNKIRPLIKNQKKIIERINKEN